MASLNSRKIERVTIVGAGFMGHGIGQEFALAKCHVVLYDLTTEKLAQARQDIRRNLAELVDLGILFAAQVQPTLDRIRTTTSLQDAAAEADLVVEAVYEDLELKQRVFRDLDRICPPEAILASNTSTFKPSVLASVTSRPERVLGCHFFYPPSLLPLVEIVPGGQTADQVVSKLLDLLLEMGKSPIVVRKEALGFIANRLQFALQREALHIVAEGIATPQEVDIAVKDGFGRRLAVAGPFEIAEPIGWDLELQVQKYLFPDLAASPYPSPLVVQKVEKGELGAKTGVGFYEWTRQASEAWRTKMTKALARFVQICPDLSTSVRD